MQSWQQTIEKFSVDDLLRVFPELGVNTAYAWKSGRRSPPEYSQPALAAWLASNARPTRKNGSKARPRKHAAA